MRYGYKLNIKLNFLPFFIQKHFLRAYRVTGTVLGTKDSETSKKCPSLFSRS